MTDHTDRSPLHSPLITNSGSVSGIFHALGSGNSHKNMRADYEEFGTPLINIFGHILWAKYKKQHFNKEWD